MNGSHTPMFLRDNRWTRIIERAAEQNAMDGKPAGRMLEQISMTGSRVIPAAQVRRMNPQEAARTDFRPEPEDPRAAMMANARAAALGISNDMRPTLGDDLPGDIGHVADEPTDADIDAMLSRARGQSMPGIEVASEGAAAPGPIRGPQAAERVALPRGVPAQTGLAGPRMMPNFANVEGFDLTRKVAVVDGMEFRLAEDDVIAMKKYAIQVVLDNVTYQLAQALVALGIPQEMAEATAEKMRETAAAGATPGGMSGTNGAESAGAGTTVEEVQQVQRGEATGSVLPGQVQPRRIDNPVQELRGDLQYLLEEEGDQPAIHPNAQGNSSTPPQPMRELRPSNDAASLLGLGEITPS